MRLVLVTVAAALTADATVVRATSGRGTGLGAEAEERRFFLLLRNSQHGEGERLGCGVQVSRGF